MLYIAGGREGHAGQEWSKNIHKHGIPRIFPGISNEFPLEARSRGCKTREGEVTYRDVKEKKKIREKIMSLEM